VLPLEDRELNYGKVCYGCGVNMKVIAWKFYVIFVTKVAVTFRYSK
jgi:hypothetical protein